MGDVVALLSCLMRRSAQSANSNHLVWAFLKQHWTDLVSKYTLSGNHITELLIAAAQSFHSTLDLEDMRAWMETHPLSSAQHSSAAALTIIEQNIAFVDNSLPPLCR